ncbi:MAG: hypothetical protein FWB76_00330 [Oscillospiraceae bacterium]|nr:hypothetical protein [Oscillospiraceae bacterium]
MSTQQFNREANYQAALSMARDMLRQGVIDDDDFVKIEAHFRMKFSPCFSAFGG